MKTRNLLIVSLIFCFYNSPAQDTLTRKLVNFEKLSVSDGIIVQLEKGNQETVTFKYEGVDGGKIISEVKDGELSLKIPLGYSKDTKVRAYLTYKTLTAISGSSKAEIDSKSLFKGDSLKIDLRSGAKIYASFDINYLQASIIEGAVLSADGYAVIQQIDVSTSGTFSGYNLEGDSITVKASAGGKAKINAEKELDAIATLKGYISYKGNPKIKRIEPKFGGTIEKYKE
jgi:hypothetical protein